MHHPAAGRAYAQKCAGAGQLRPPCRPQIVPKHKSRSMQQLLWPSYRTCMRDPYVRLLAAAPSCCRNVVHRDLKLENLLLASPDEITKVISRPSWCGSCRWHPHSSQHDAHTLQDSSALCWCRWCNRTKLLMQLDQVRQAAADSSWHTGFKTRICNSSVKHMKHTA